MKKNRYLIKSTRTKNFLITVLVVLMVFSITVSFIIFNGFNKYISQNPEKASNEDKLKLKDELDLLIENYGLKDEWIRKSGEDYLRWKVKIPKEISIEEFSLKIYNTVRKNNGKVIENKSETNSKMYIWINDERFGEINLISDTEATIHKGDFAILYTGIGEKKSASIDYILSLPFIINVGIKFNGSHSTEIFKECKDRLIENWLMLENDFIDSNKLLNFNYINIKNEIDNIFFIVERKKVDFKGIIWKKITFQEKDYIILNALLKYLENRTLPFILISKSENRKEEILKEYNINTHLIKDRIVFLNDRKKTEIKNLFNYFVKNGEERIILLPSEEKVVKTLCDEVLRMMEQGYKFKNLSYILKYGG